MSVGLLDRLLLGPFAGELSPLRTEGKPWTSFGSSYSAYTLDSSKVDYPLARALYRNSEDRYKLGGWAAKPVVNTAAGFMGAPKFTHEDDGAQEMLDEGPNTFDSHFLRINRDCSRDGDTFVRLIPRIPRFTEGQGESVQIQTIPPEWVESTTDTLTGELTEVLITWPVKNTKRDETGRIETTESYKVIERITPETRELKASPEAPLDAQSKLEAMQEEDRSNPWKFIPIVPFMNEREANALHGTSDLEPIEPFMRAYHDVLKAAIGGARQFARPKTAFSLKSVEAFLKNNFGDNYRQLETLPFGSRDVFLMVEGETAEFMSASFDVGSVVTLLELIFYCIVDVSETPEFAFGTAVASSKASVSEQMPVLGRRIERKRGDYSEPYRELSSMYLSMRAATGAPALKSYKTEVDWSEFSPKDEGEVATMLNNLIGALVTGVDEGLVSHQSAVEFVQQYVPTMSEYIVQGNTPGERERIAEGLALLNRLRSEAPEVDENGKPILKTVEETA